MAGDEWNTVTTDAPTRLPSPVLVFRPDKCANLACANRVGEGQFGVVTIHAKRLPVVLGLCWPCVESLRAVLPR